MRAPRTPKKAADAPAAPERLRRVKRNPEMEVAFGARIRAARIAAHMSQGALGEAVGISFQQVQKYELGKDRVALSTLQDIAEALGVHPGSFFDESMPAPVGRSIPDVKRAIRSADVLGQIRDPRVLNRLLALVKALAEQDGMEARETVDHPDCANAGHAPVARAVIEVFPVLLRQAEASGATTLARCIGQALSEAEGIVRRTS